MRLFFVPISGKNGLICCTLDCRVKVDYIYIFVFFLLFGIVGLIVCGILPGPVMSNSLKFKTFSFVLFGYHLSKILAKFTSYPMLD